MEKLNEEISVDKFEVEIFRVRNPNTKNKNKLFILISVTNTEIGC